MASPPPPRQRRACLRTLTSTFASPMVSLRSRRSCAASVCLFVFSLQGGHAFIGSGFTQLSRNSGQLAISPRIPAGALVAIHDNRGYLRRESQARLAPCLECEGASKFARGGELDRRKPHAPPAVALALVVWQALVSIVVHSTLGLLNTVMSIPRRFPKAILGSVVLLACVLCGTAVTAFSAASMSAPLKGGIASLPTLAALRAKFMLNWRLYVTIPVVAGLLNWATNKLAVNMIFYPLEFWGLRIKTWAEQPFGLVGWTGIVPVKARPMATRMVRMVTSSLIDVKEVAKRVDPNKIADILAPVAEQTIENVGKDLKVSWALQSPLVFDAAVSRSKQFVADFTVKMQDNIDDILDLEGMVVRAMVNDKRVLVELFQECGSKELRFVVNSGLYLGFLLGIAQMALWLCWDPWWSLAVGGASVGYLTNFIAIKSIFEPVDPIRIGPLKVQGLFLTRQKEVSSQFAAFLRERCLTSELIWREILTGAKKDAFYAMLDRSVEEWVRSDVALKVARSAVGAKLAPTVSSELKQALNAEVHRVCPYMDDVLDLERTMESKMRAMSSQQFESVLHPIFEEDELTLILVGAALGAAAGFLQSMAPY